MGHTPTLTVIVPTIFRRTLSQCLESFADELLDGDACIVSFDGDYNDELDDLVKEFAGNYPLPNWTFLWGPHQGCWGHPATNKAFSHVRTSHVWRMDDDDKATMWAVDSIRDGITENPDSVLIYKMTFGPFHPACGITLWREDPPKARYGEIGTPMIVAPVSDARFGNRYEGDWDYLQALLIEFGEPIFVDRVVAEIRAAKEDDA